MMSQGPTIAVVGGGQLGQMLALAGIPLGLRFRFLDPAGPDAPAASVGEVISGPLDDWASILELVKGADAVTYEFENLPATHVEDLESMGVEVFPCARALALAQDRWHEKEYFQALGIPTAKTFPADDFPSLQEACGAAGFPCVVKTRREGYDGKGQVVVRSSEEIREAWEALEPTGQSLVVEAWVPFDEEFSVLVVRSRSGEVRAWPACQNEHRGGILRVTRVETAHVSAPIYQDAASMVCRMVNDLGYVGVLAVEFFRVGDRVLANEMAPRVHNSGHWTQDGAVTSQFENHVRAVLGLPLGPTDLRMGPGGGVAMVNYIGGVPSLEAVWAHESDTGGPMVGQKLHLYGKTPRPGRKLGHLNLWSSSVEALDEVLSQQLALASDPPMD